MASDQSCMQCASCGLEIHDDLVHGLCPRCLLTAGVKECVSAEAHLPEDGATAETIDSDHTQNGPAERIAIGPKILGNYEVVGEIARGGMGVVYHARHQSLGRDVALKLILSGGFASERDIRRFHLEAESAATLDHPGIVPIYEIGQQDGHHFFAMKLIDGGSLSENMSRFRADHSEFVQLLIGVADAIDYAHRRGILHRDLKPANILLDSDGNPIVTDLGLAKHTDGDSDLTGTGAIVGTPAYMPPEQANAAKEITTAVDIYSLGAILYDGLTGRPPHQAESAVATLMEAARGEVVAPSQLNPSIDRTLELICMKCLARDPGERYASANEFKSDLQNWLSGKSVSVRPKSLVSICGELLGNQLRSVFGAMLLGIFGGLALGLPLYSGLANRWFGRPGARFNLSELSKQLPSSEFVEPWWVRPPEALVIPLTMLGIPFCLFLGAMICRLVRPQDIRQAVAVGLVAGLFMAIVQFAVYGIAANWQTFAMANADRIEQLALAGFAEPSIQQGKISDLLAQYPDLKDKPPAQQAHLLGQLVSIEVMLTSPPIAMGCLLVCLVFAGIFCLLGTTHAYRLTRTRFSLANRTFRYLELLVISTMAGLVACIGIFSLFGMIRNESGPVGIAPNQVALLVVLVLAVVPGWLQKRWSVRWSTYLAAATLSFTLLLK